MASFSTNSALTNLSGARTKRAQKPAKNFEYENFQEYKTAGGSATSLEAWDGSDAKWLRSDREGKGKGCNPKRWQRAVVEIIKGQLQNRLAPFEQVADFYHYAQVLVEVRKHESKWAKGAFYLVNDLADLYDQWVTINRLNFFYYSPTVFFDLKLLLSSLNTAIANFSVRQFHRLIFGEFKNSPRTGLNAWKFDEQFIIQEQRDNAYGIYSIFENTAALQLANDIFNKQGIFVELANLFKALLYIPVYPDQYISNLTENSSRFGENGRIQVPLAMLYPNHLFFNDSEDPSDPHDFDFSQTKFGRTLKRGFYKQFQYHDRDAGIFRDYNLTNKRISYYFKYKK